MALTVHLVDRTEPAVAFQRVRDAYDLERLANCVVVYVGVGGAAAFAEDLARSGVGKHVLIDPDIVSETNLATQQVYRRDLGRPKVACVAERIRDINPSAEVIPLAFSLDDLDDAAFERLLDQPLGRKKPGTVLLCGLTDSFAAQSRINRLALHLGLPSLCAQVYREGRGAEVTFTHPETTPACHRCVLSGRYRAYDEGFRNDVTSDGTPIFATAALNALKGFVALAILHHGMQFSERVLMDFPDGEEDGGVTLRPNPAFRRWGRLLERIGDRNLIQLRMDPDMGDTLGIGVFDRVFSGADQARILFDEVVWLPQRAEGPATGSLPCPDCGGSGDLRVAIGTFDDTRHQRACHPSQLPVADVS